MRPTPTTTPGFFGFLDASGVPPTQMWLFIRDNLARVSGVELPALGLDAAKGSIASLIKDTPVPSTRSEYVAMFKIIAEAIKQQATSENTISLDPSTAPVFKNEDKNKLKEAHYALKETRD
eukprot:Gregarina_sp_Poly_1__1481@NODE_1370_length_4273_cov_48_215882_g918_i0_p3_GENE_NODE_1370_length_4273_cov_48_215882_g918_i0NODE_1370_length_4273_cov_48_215882_g918_i0_p3_ORF_typecomplete_len121_score16_94_NODE_1370_length_4273_cov_48_215882_g918_i038494211